MSRIRRVLPFGVAILALCLSAACSDDKGTGPEPEPEPEGIPTDHTEPDALITAYAAAINASDYDAYMALLEPESGARAPVGFRFVPRSDDLSDFPWMVGDSWGRADEAIMIGNMFDPAFAESAGSDARRVEQVQADLILRSTSDVEGGGVRMVCDGELFVWFNSTDAFRTVCVLDFLLVLDPDGFWRIREQQERELLLRAVGSGVDSATWGSIKALYR